MSDHNDLLRSLSEAYTEISEKTYTGTNDQRFAKKAQDWKDRTGGTDYTAYLAGGGDAATRKNLKSNNAGRSLRNAVTGGGYSRSGQAARDATRETQQRGTSALASRKRASNTAPEGAFGISASGRRQAAHNRSGQSITKPVKPAKPSGGSSGSSGSSMSGSRSSGSSSSSSSAPAAKPKVRDYGSKSANMQAWAKANPKLASKVKPGQSGYKSINSSASTSKNPMKSSSSSSSPAKSSSSSSSSSSSKGGSMAAALAKPIARFKAEEFDNMVNYMMQEGYADNETSAKALVTHMSDEWFEYLISE